jgi:transposase-like protein
MKRIPRAVYTVEYKVAAVHQVLGGKKAAEVARELGVVEQTLHILIVTPRTPRSGSSSLTSVALFLSHIELWKTRRLRQPLRCRSPL